MAKNEKETKKSANAGKRRRSDDEKYDSYKEDDIYDDGEDIKEKKEKKEKPPVDPSAPKYQVATVALAALALFVVICYAFPESCGKVGYYIRLALYGVFSGGAILVPFMILIHAIYLKRDVKNGAVVYKFFFSLAIIIFTSVLLHAFFSSSADFEYLTFRDTKKFFELGTSLRGGGVVGGTLGSIMMAGVGLPGTLIFSVLLLVIFGIFLFGLTPSVFWKRIAFYYLRFCENRQKNKKARAEAEAERKKAEAEKAVAVVNTNDASSRADIDDIFSDDFISSGKESADKKGKDDGAFAQEESLEPEKKYTVTSYEPEEKTSPSSSSSGFSGSTEHKAKKADEKEEDNAPWEDNSSVVPADGTKGADPIRDELRRTLDITRKKMNQMNGTEN
ncbi:MAG: hypothetical protein ACI4QR_03190, partial [Eubacteriales bacterium]